MRMIASVLWTLFVLALVGLALWGLGLGPALRSNLAAGHLIDWIMGCLCFVWLLVILKAPWDLYFQAHEVSFEIQRSRERGIAVIAGREDYILRLRTRLLGLAVGAHILSALFVALATYWTHGLLGYYFAAFYVVSTVFRPAVAGYVYLSRKLSSIGEETRYPREDVLELRQKLEWLEAAAKSQEDRDDAAIYTSIGVLPDRFDEHQQQLELESQTRETEVREVRQRLHAMAREFETAMSRLTDNQEVIRGIQAFVRLVSQAAPTAES